MFRKTGNPERHLWRLAAYAFFRACEKEGTFEVKNAIFDEADKERLPANIETTVERMVKI